MKSLVTVSDSWVWSNYKHPDPLTWQLWNTNWYNKYLFSTGPCPTCQLDTSMLNVIITSLPCITLLLFLTIMLSTSIRWRLQSMSEGRQTVAATIGSQEIKQKQVQTWWNDSAGADAGFPQNAVLGTLLFIMYTPLNTLISSLSHNHHHYADNTQHFFSFQPPNYYSSITQLRNAIQQIS